MKLQQLVNRARQPESATTCWLPAARHRLVTTVAGAAKPHRCPGRSSCLASPRQAESVARSERSHPAQFGTFLTTQEVTLRTARSSRHQTLSSNSAEACRGANIGVRLRIVDGVGRTSPNPGWPTPSWAPCTGWPPWPPRAWRLLIYSPWSPRKFPAWWTSRGSAWRVMRPTAPQPTAPVSHPGIR
ncbi:MAG: hypothetical protein QOJ20_1365 [Mycobacterium sp.]|nr:hypothetical protein [Mycobacterium sp.]